MDLELEVQLLIKLKKLVIEQQLFFTQNNEEIQKILCYLDLPKYENTLKHEYLKIINEQIENKCQHNYVTDYIDIDPDNSTRIQYCSICEHTK